MTWQKDKFLLIAGAFAVLMVVAGIQHDLGPAMLASWFCGANFMVWCESHLSKPAGDAALRETKL